MFEYPEILSTKEDYLNMLEYDREETIRRLKLLLEDKYIWVENRTLSADDQEIEDENHFYLVYHNGKRDGERIEYKKVLNEHSTAHSLGFTFEEIEELIGGSDVNDIRLVTMGRQQ